MFTFTLEVLCSSEVVFVGICKDIISNIILLLPYYMNEYFYIIIKDRQEYKLM